ncbi:uncharacterized protein LOC108671554 [Hyalella azteca]|uniref:Uncharacterized protein LOC108671554 n=1 Tax=Hyalella azteca TaxID=294128 RepID=A0A8B7NLQ3_HYAAZ|nr:uncharacterized protein LOC108671554 [Hyalella azteca]
MSRNEVLTATCADSNGKTSIEVSEVPLEDQDVAERCLYVSDASAAVQSYSLPSIHGLAWRPSEYCSSPPSYDSSSASAIRRFKELPVRCHLCRRSKSFTRPLSLMLHIHKFHVRKAVQVAGYTLLCCHLCAHRNAHYHCPHCSYSSSSMTDIKRHFLTHSRSQTATSHSSKKQKYPSILRINLNKRELLAFSKQFSDVWLRRHRGARARGYSRSTSYVVSDFVDTFVSSSVPRHSFESISDEKRVLREHNCSSGLDACPAIEDTMNEIKKEPLLDYEIGDVTVPPLFPVDSIAVKAEGDESSDVLVHVFPSEEVSRNWRLSLPASIQAAFDKLSSERCYLCSQNLIFESKLALEIHFYRHHVRHSIVEFDCCVGLVCNLGCYGMDRHCHCHRCSFLAEDLIEVRTHYAKYHAAGGDRKKHQGSNSAKNKYSSDRLCNAQNQAFAADRLSQITGLECSTLLCQLLELEVDADAAVICPMIPSRVRESIVLDAVTLHAQIRPPYCLLCDDGREYKTSRLLLQHFQRSHVKRANRSCALPSLMCRLSCKGFCRGHYHCPLCPYVMHDLTKLKVHQQKLHGCALGNANKELFAGRTITAESLARLEGGEDAVREKTCRGSHVRHKTRPLVANMEGSDVPCPLPVSIVQDIASARSLLSLPDCYLCRFERNFFTERRLADHFERMHMKRSVDFPPYRILSCHLHNDKYRDRGHFHCPWCFFVTHDRLILRSHLTKHSCKLKLANRTLEAPKNCCEGREITGPSRDKEAVRPVMRRCGKTQLRLWKQRFNAYVNRNLGSELGCVLRLVNRRMRQQITNLINEGISDASQKCPASEFRLVETPKPAKQLVKITSTARAQDVTSTHRWPEAPSPGGVGVSNIIRTSGDASGSESPGVAGHEELFDVLYSAHVTASGVHVPASDMVSHLPRQFALTPRRVVMKFIEWCPVCQRAARQSFTQNNNVKLLKSDGFSTDDGTVMKAASRDDVMTIRRVTVEMFTQLQTSATLSPGPGGREEDSSVRQLSEIETPAAIFKGGLEAGALLGAAHREVSQDSRNFFAPMGGLGSLAENSTASSCELRGSEEKRSFSANRFMDVMLVNVIDMRDHPDRGHHYIVHCQDAHTRLHFLLALRQLRPSHIARCIIRKVLAVTGVPALIVSNNGNEFVQSLVSQISLMWTGSCSALVDNCKSQSAAAARSDIVCDSSDVLRELTRRLLDALHDQRHVSWTLWLPYIQYTLNTETKLPQLTPFQAVFRRSVAGAVKKADVTPHDLQDVADNILGYCPPHSPSESSDAEETSKEEENNVEVMDVTTASFSVDDGILNYVEVILPKEEDFGARSDQPEMTAPLVNAFKVQAEIDRIKTSDRFSQEVSGKLENSGQGDLNPHGVRDAMIDPQGSGLPESTSLRLSGPNVVPVGIFPSLDSDGSDDSLFV